MMQCVFRQIRDELISKPAVDFLFKEGSFILN